ncbi:MAG: FtsQ-type POTRA domain-containing protein [Planctomycetes bacterium]|nr:FtsQ-type POTRA domain-containing protein [Planctomycetota bacterium]
MTSSKSPQWALRVFVLGAFAVTVWLAGPRAVAVLAARLDRQPQTGPMVELDHVGFRAMPPWLDRALLTEVSAALSPWLSDSVGILDEATSRRLRDGLVTVPWVDEVTVERVFPDRFRLHVGLRRPVLAVRSADDVPLCLVDRDAVMLPWVETGLPSLRLYREGGRAALTPAPGEPAVDARVRCAAALACEWRDELAPLVAGCPQLLEIDASNLGERWLVGPEYPELRVVLRRADGERVVFAYGRPVDSPQPRVPVRTKATVLDRVLQKHPGLQGLVAGDLRLANRWADYLQPRAQGVPSPYGPWSDLPVPGGR